MTLRTGRCCSLGLRGPGGWKRLRTQGFQRGFPGVSDVWAWGSQGRTIRQDLFVVVRMESTVRSRDTLWTRTSPPRIPRLKDENTQRASVQPPPKALRTLSSASHGSPPTAQGYCHRGCFCMFLCNIVMYYYITRNILNLELCMFNFL